MADGDWIESKDQSKNGIRLIQTGNIGNGIFKLKEDKAHFITEETMSRLGCTEIFEGDCLVSRLPEPVGRACIIPSTGHRMITAVDCSIIRFKNEYLSRFFIYYTQCSKYLNCVNDYITGTTRKRISRKNLEKIPIPVPPLEEQERIVERLDAAFAKIDELKANAEQELADARALFNASLNEAMQPKKGWEKKPICEIFKTYSGGTPIKSNKSYYENGNIPWIRSGEVCKRFITECELFITEDGLKNSSAKFYPIDTVLVAMYGATAAQVGILKFPATSNQAVCGILPNNNFLPDFVYFWFKHIEKQLASQAQGGAQPNISQEKIKKVLIPFIPIAEQEAIVERLDKLSAQVREMEEIHKQTIAECDALKQALLRETFE